MPGGTLPVYIKKHPDVDRVGLVGSNPTAFPHTNQRHQLSDVAQGLCYLHSFNVVHGDIQGVCTHYKYSFAAGLIPCQLSILVDDSGHARITCLGEASTTNDEGSLEDYSGIGGTSQWAAPETLEHMVYNKKSDIFSFALVMTEVCYGATVGRASVHRRLVSV